ncbi:unnamed protein product, partial [Ixodes hexagonus]
MANGDFQRHYRLSKNVVQWLCDEIRGDPALRRQRRARTVMTVERQVLCALRFYATGGFQGLVAGDRNIGVHQTSVSRAIRAVSTAIVRRLARQWIAFPATAEVQATTREAFLRLGALPGVVGCVDGTFVAIRGPSKFDTTVTTALYLCRKLYYALNVMVVCDADMRILGIDPRFHGSTYDSLVWRRSLVRQRKAQRVRHISKSLIIFYAFDSGYPLEPWLMNPVPGRPAITTPAGRYNHAHACMRAVVERCIGLLKSRFRCLHRHRALHHHPRIAGTIVVACAVLHNICLCSGESEPEPPSDSESDSSSDDEDDEETSEEAEERRALQSRRLYIQ